MSDRKLVHVVDDDEEVCRSTAFMLRSAGLECTYWTSGTSFLEGADTASQGCVILDVRMSDYDGFAVQQVLGQRESLLQVIMVSGHGDRAMARRAIEAGALDFIEKPYDQSGLLLKVEQALSRQAC